MYRRMAEKPVEYWCRMEGTDVENWQERPLSALALRTYRECPLRFRYRYVDGLYWSRALGTTPEQQRLLERGRNFHLLARRYYAGVEPATIADPVEQKELQHWLRLLEGFLPRTFDRAFYPELELRLKERDLCLIAKFDLLVVDPDGGATIFDWKTERRPTQRLDLLRSEQTLVYRYLLCAAGGAYSPHGRFRPEEVAMVYWNPMHPHRWERLPYSQEEFERDAEALRQVVEQIRSTPPHGFRPTDDARVCQRCEFQVVCHGRRLASAVPDVEPPERESEAEAGTKPWEDLPDLP